MFRCAGLKPKMFAPTAMTQWVPVRAKRHDGASNQAILRRALQLKLSVGRTDDPLEHEADQVADHVMRMPAPQLTNQSAPLAIQRKCAACEDEAVQRKCAACEDEEAMQVQTKAAGAAQTTTPMHAVSTTLRSPGQPLDAGARAFMEPRFGRDFSRVRVHNGDRASASAHGIGALAYTYGSHIVFRSGEYAPSSDRGRRLLAHELAHTAQQQDGSVHSMEDGVLRRAGCGDYNYKTCGGQTCTASDGKTGRCKWSGSIANGCVCYGYNLSAAQQVLYAAIAAALVAAGILLTEAAAAAIIACLAGPCEIAALVVAIGAVGAAIVMGIINGSGSGASAGGPGADPSTGGDPGGGTDPDQATA